jgi:hypothetical protein
MVRSDLGSAGVIFTLDTETGFRDVVLITGAYHGADGERDRREEPGAPAGESAPGEPVSNRLSLPVTSARGLCRR